MIGQLGDAPALESESHLAAADAPRRRDDVEKAVARDVQGVKALADRVAGEALELLQSGLPPGSVVVTNPLGFERTDVVHVPGFSGSGGAVLVDEAGRRAACQFAPDGLRFVATLPAFGTAAYRLEDAHQLGGAGAGAGEPAISLGERQGDSYAGASYVTVDSPHLRATVRKDCGVITTLYDKRAGRELVGYNIAGAVACEQVRPDLALGVLQLLDEHPHSMSSWVVDEVHSEESLVRGGTLEVIEDGPVRVVLEARQSFRSSSATKRLVFYAELPRIDIELDVDWQENGSPEAGIPSLALAFTSRLHGARAWYETPFAAASRPTDGLVVPGLRWADIGDDGYGIAVLNDGKYGYDALGTRLRVHVIRSAYDPDTSSDLGRRDRTRFSVVPHQGHWADAGIPRQAASFDLPLTGRIAPEVPGEASAAPAGWHPHLLGETTVVIAALKFSAGGSGARVVRLYESAGRTATARLAGLGAGTLAYEATILEDRTGGLPIRDQTVELTFRPFQVRTVLVEQPRVTSRPPPAGAGA
ncbi:MAG: glycoside hydrolase family 38 C-terminal domain-containing protein [Acidimicrobiales bacterium]